MTIFSGSIENRFVVESIKTTSTAGILNFNLSSGQPITIPKFVTDPDQTNFVVNVVGTGRLRLMDWTATTSTNLAAVLFRSAGTPIVVDKLIKARDGRHFCTWRCVAAAGIECPLQLGSGVLFDQIVTIEGLWRLTGSMAVTVSGVTMDQGVILDALKINSSPASTVVYLNSVRVLGNCRLTGFIRT